MTAPDTYVSAIAITRQTIADDLGGEDPPNIEALISQRDLWEACAVDLDAALSKRTWERDEARAEWHRQRVRADAMRWHFNDLIEEIANLVAWVYGHTLHDWAGTQAEVHRRLRAVLKSAGGSDDAH